MATVLIPPNVQNSPPNLERSCSPSKWELAEEILIDSPSKHYIIADIHPSGWVHIVVKELGHSSPRKRSFCIPNELATALINNADKSFFPNHFL